MPAPGSQDAVVVGSGPNGLAAAVTLAEAGWAVRLLEGKDAIGGGLATEELTLPGFLHDVCSAIHPFAASSPFFRAQPLAGHGLEWVFPPADVAHPFDDGTAAVLSRSVDATAATLGPDEAAYRRLVSPFLDELDALLPDLLAPILHFPHRPLRLARFGLLGLRSARSLAEGRFRGPKARGLFAGLAAHSMRPLDSPLTASFGLIFALLGHARGWPLPRGGSRRIAQALAGRLAALGGAIETGRLVARLEDLPESRAAVFDLTPRQLLAIAGSRFPAGYRRRLARYRYGPAAFKLDYALDGPIPWTARECATAGTVHLGGTFEEIAASEVCPWRGVVPEAPFVLVAQQSLFDLSRAPEGRHTAWAYCHVPHGCAEDVTDRIESQIERFAPGFHRRILARTVTTPADLEQRNPNLIGGDIAGGSTHPWQVLFRPFPRRSPYSTPDPRLFLCSSSTPPGPGVHGMCGYHAARAVLARGAGG